MVSRKEHILTVAERLKRARREAGLTQAQAGKLFGVSQSVISMQEAGQRRVSAADAQRMSEVYSAVALRKLNVTGQRLPGTEATELAVQLAALGGSELETAADNFLALCAYLLMREIYSVNPDNPGDVFRLDEDRAELLKESISDELDKIRRFAAYSNKVKREDIAPGQLLERRITTVADSCETLIRGTAPEKETI